MWFFKQAQQVIPTPMREPEIRREPVVVQAEPIAQAVQAEPVVMQVDATPAREWFADVVRPLERSAEVTSAARVDDSMDGVGWWIDETQ